MITGACRAAALAAGVLASTGAWAKAPAPLVPIALVEDINSSSSSTDVEFMDYVGTGQVIKLAPRDVLVLSYLRSCAHETITGGTVTIGADRSDVVGGKIARAKVPCNGGKMQLATQQANASGASAFRLQSAAIDPVLYAVAPMVQLPKLQANDSRTLVIERLDKTGERVAGERVEFAIGTDSGAFYDLAKAKAKPLTRGGIYRATLGPNKVTFKIDAKAKTGKTPVVSRLLRFPPG